MVTALLCFNLLILIASGQSPVCKGSDGNGHYEQWIVMHESCWGDCVKVKSKTNNEYKLDVKGKGKSCGDRAVEFSVPNAQTDPPPKCKWLKMGGHKNVRAYCSKAINYATPSANTVNEHRGADEGGCGAEPCFTEGRTITTRQHCRTENNPDGHPGANIRESIKCPPGTIQNVNIFACVEGDVDGVILYTQEYVCKVKGSVTSIEFTDLNTEYEPVYKGYFKVIYTDNNKADEYFKINGKNYDAGTATAPASAHNLDDNIFDENNEYDNLRIIKSELKDAQMRMKKEIHYKEQQKKLLRGGRSIKRKHHYN